MVVTRITQVLCFVVCMHHCFLQAFFVYLVTRPDDLGHRGMGEGDREGSAAGKEHPRGV